jgi:hypothetical protein
MLLGGLRCTSVFSAVSGRVTDIVAGTYLMRAGHARLVLSICPLPLLLPVMKNVALALY